MSNLTRALLVLVVLAMSSTGTRAESLLFTTTPNTGSQGRVDHQTDGSFRLQTFDGSSNGKASVIFYKGFGVSLGTLGSLTNFSADFLKVSPTDNIANSLAIRLLTNTGGTQGLVWENNYNLDNDYNVDGAFPRNAWVPIDLTGDKYWERANSANFDSGNNFKTLGQWAAGFTPAGGATLSSSTNIYGIEVSYGSTVGPFDGSVRNVNLSFGNTQYTAAEFREDAAATPLPSAALGGLACLGLFATGRLRRPPTEA